MPRADILKEQIARAKGTGGAPKLTIHFAGEDEEAFNLDEWEIAVDVGLPRDEDTILILQKLDGSQVVVILFVNVAFYRVEV